MPVNFIKPLELRQFLVGFLFSLQPGVRQKQLIAYARILIVELDAALQEWQRLIVTPQLHQQSTEIVIRRIRARIELNSTPQQSLCLDVFTSLAGDVTKTGQRIGIVRLQLQDLLKRCDCLIVLSFRTRCVAQQKIQI